MPVVVCGCGDELGRDTELLECPNPDSSGMTCEQIDPAPPSEDCQWELSCGSYALCRCDDNKYTCDIGTVHAGDSCDGRNGRCQSGCDDPNSDQVCTCVDGTWQCTSDCPADCPRTRPVVGDSCTLDPSIGCSYDRTQTGCSCVDGVWACEL
jgi:hypothetical protein